MDVYDYRLFVAEQLSKLYADEASSDFAIVADDREWKVHKAVLYIHSDVLYRMSTSSNFQESKNGRAELKDVEACQVDTMIRFMYGMQARGRNGRLLADNYIDSAEQNGHSTKIIDRFEYYTSLVRLADMYNVVKFKDHALSLLGKWLRGRSASDMTQVIEEAWSVEETAQEVRDVVLKHCSYDFYQLHSQDFTNVVGAYPKFAAQLLLLMAREQYSSPSGNRGWSDIGR